MYELKPADTTETNKAERDITLTWRTPSNDTAAGFGDEPGESFATLHCWHSKDRKQFIASLNRHSIVDMGGYKIRRSVIDYGVSGGGVILRENVARYSATALEIFAAKALAALKAHYEAGTEAVVAYLPVADVNIDAS